MEDGARGQGTWLVPRSSDESESESRFLQSECENQRTKSVVTGCQRATREALEQPEGREGGRDGAE